MSRIKEVSMSILAATQKRLFPPTLIHRSEGQRKREVDKDQRFSALYERLDQLPVSLASRYHHFGLVFENLSYRDEDGHMVLAGLNMTIEQGKKYLLLGTEESGNAELLKILSHQIQEYDGNVYVGHQNLKELQGKALERILAFIHKNIFVLNDTIYRNIALHPHYDEKKVRESMRRVGLNERPETNTTDIALNRGFYSANERQKISIARALVNNSSILILDSTSDCTKDCEVEELILNIRDMTVLSVSHILSKELVDRYDKIFVLDEGRVVEEGSFSDLLLQGGHFYSMYVRNEAI